MVPLLSSKCSAFASAAVVLMAGCLVSSAVSEDKIIKTDLIRRKQKRAFAVTWLLFLLQRI
jgi:hypothetical protein